MFCSKKAEPTPFTNENFEEMATLFVWDLLKPRIKRGCLDIKLCVNPDYYFCRRRSESIKRSINDRFLKGSGLTLEKLEYDDNKEEHADFKCQGYHIKFTLEMDYNKPPVN